MLYPAESPELTPYSFVEVYVMAINITRLRSRAYQSISPDA